MLGHCRVKKTDINDLKGIAYFDKLAPWIKSLTFGTARIGPPRFSRPARHDYLRCPTGSLDVSKSMLRQLDSNFVKAYDSEQRTKDDLAEVLPAFSNVKNARIII
jgi:hypothetical protein